jgi:S-adenosylmethionine hydrolase
VPFVRTFGEVEEGDLLLYEDSNGCLAIGVNQGSAAERLRLVAGDHVRVRRGATVEA